jgi:phage FluMu gp28-like protein
VKFGYINFDNGSRIIAFSSNPYAMAVFEGDVGLDEFAKHQSAEKLWETAQGRITWGYDLSVWSAHDGTDTLFYQFAQEARAGKGGWSHYRVTMEDAVEMGLVEKINETRGTNYTRAGFLADCRQRARLEEIYQQAYMCNPSGSTSAIVPWASIQNCQRDYTIPRVHLEAGQIIEAFGSRSCPTRLRALSASKTGSIRCSPPSSMSRSGYRLGFRRGGERRGRFGVDLYGPQVASGAPARRALHLPH